VLDDWAGRTILGCPVPLSVPPTSPDIYHKYLRAMKSGDPATILRLYCLLRAGSDRPFISVGVPQHLNKQVRHATQSPLVTRSWLDTAGPGQHLVLPGGPSQHRHGCITGTHTRPEHRSAVGLSGRCAAEPALLASHD
jgi:hypothetical protein